MGTPAGRPPPAGRRATCELVAMGLLRRTADTRVARVFIDRLFRDLAGHPAPDWDAALDAVAETQGLAPPARLARVADARQRAASILGAADRRGIEATTILDPDYPALLRVIADPPLVLWTRGRWPAWPGVAIVGSRNASADGLFLARRLACGLSEAGLTVVSGLALGIDAAAHGGALDGPSATVAVLGSGPDVVYPSAHRHLAERIERRGCLLSEFLPGDRPLAWHFPVRNRIISGLSRAVVVIEASRRSGSLITAREALDQGREVMAVPGSVTSGCYQGCHDLIKDGARLVETVDEILDELGWDAPGGARHGRPSRWPVDSPLSGVLAPGTPCGLDALVLRTGKAANELLAELARLELDGLVARVPGGQFVRLD